MVRFGNFRHKRLKTRLSFSVSIMTARHDGPHVVYYRAYQIAFIAIKNSLSWKYINLFHQGNTTLPMMQWIGGTLGRFLSSPLNGRPEQAKLVKTIHLNQWCPDKNIHNIDEGLPMIFSLLWSQTYIFWSTQHKLEHTLIIKKMPTKGPKYYKTRGHGKLCLSWY